MSKAFLSELKRTHGCGELNASHEDQNVVLMGWVDTRRDHGGLIFIDLRDRSGIVQLTIDPSNNSNVSAKDFRNEFVIAIEGTVKKRPEGMINNKISTGEVEIIVSRSEMLTPSAPVPFQKSDNNVSESVRLKYRYLDLRGSKMQTSMKVRHQFYQTVRKTLNGEDFWEIETPILYKSTPEGARDYLVPSRVTQGSFYALPQSPQTLKQLLMIGGMERYYQIARCFRDEDLRADRQPEFTQIDLEMSFVDQNDVIDLNEKLLRSIWKDIKGLDIKDIPRMTFDEALNRYGTDRPDIRFGMELFDLSEELKATGFKVFDSVLEGQGVIKGICIPGGADLSRGQLDKLTALAKSSGVKGLVWVKSEESGITSSVSKFLSDEKLKTIVQKGNASVGDAILIVADQWEPACLALGTLRGHLARERSLIQTSEDKFLWVVDFPLFEYDTDNNRWVARHHPFTAPTDECEKDLLEQNESRFGQLKAKAYDLVCNGHEIAGGSIRIHKPKTQDAMFKALGFSKEEQEKQFGFFVEALGYGTPPHGGIAWGVDRTTMILCETDAIRDVIAFPKTAKAICLMSEAPSEVSRDQLIELGIRLAPSVEKNRRKESAEDVNP